MKPVLMFVTIMLVLFMACKKNTPEDISRVPIDTTHNPIDSVKNPIDSSKEVKIYSISPAQGLPNTTVIIKGINFNGNASDNLVKFNNIIATVVLAAKDSLIVTAPINGTTGPVTVTVDGKTATGPVFTYLEDSVLVYAAVSGYGVIYWKNDEAFFLAPVSGGFGGAFGIAVSGTDVYIAGYSQEIPAIWKNGVQTVLPVSSPARGGKANALVISGNDIYIGGSDGNVPVYWKNGVENKLPVTEAAFVNSIAVSGNDVYAAGYEVISNDQLLVFWKNGVKTILGSKSIIDYGAMSIAVLGTDVYVCGTDSGNAAYWKNGVKVGLPGFSEKSATAANAITVSGNDVYVVGEHEAYPVYWKNGIKFTLPSYSAYGGTAACITLFQSDVYIGGADGSTSVYWKNGVEHRLPGSSGIIKSLVVTKP